MSSFGKSAALLGEVREDIGDARLCVGMLKAGAASISLRPDRLAGDVEQIKRRLDPVMLPMSAANEWLKQPFDGEV